MRTYYVTNLNQLHRLLGCQKIWSLRACVANTYDSVLERFASLVLVQRGHHGHLFVGEVRHGLALGDLRNVHGLEAARATLEHNDNLDFVGDVQLDLVQGHLEHVLHRLRLRLFHEPCHFFLV